MRNGGPRRNGPGGERKSLEDAEATAISAEYARADLLPAEAAAQARDLLSRYLQQRILFYQLKDPVRLEGGRKPKG